MDIPSFLRMYPPFDALAEERLTEVVRHTHIEFFPEGALILHQGGEPARFVYVVRKGAVELVDDDQVLDLLTEGELFGHPSLLADTTPTLTCRAHEDTLCYLIDPDIAEGVLGTHSGLAFLSSSLRRRVVRALEGLDAETADPWRTPVGTLVRRDPVLAPLTFSIREAAELMTRERISSVIVEGANGPGILTDRDLRSRVLALGRSADTAIGEVMSSPVVTVPDHTIVAEVMSLMLERGIHHVPVVDADGTLVGVVTDTDLMGLEQKTPFALKADIERAPDAEAVVQAAERLPLAVCSLVEANVDPVDVGHVVAVTVDAITRRLLALSIKKQGEPPCPWAWLALGSEARQEQALKTDQDNAFVIDPGRRDMAEVDHYFQALADFVTEHLEEAGVPRCNAGVIASNPDWRNTPEGWHERFRTWIAEPTWLAGAFGAIAFDYRKIAGPLEIEAAFDQIIRAASRDERFVRRLGTTALEDRPPSGFVRDVVIASQAREDRLDIKAGGITLITNLARVHSIMAGLSENRTLRRLHEVAEVGRLDEGLRMGLEGAFRLLWQIRLEHQVHQVRAGEPPDDLVDPGALGPLARQGLKEAFRMIDRAQNGLANVLGVGR